MDRALIKRILAGEVQADEVLVCGWVRTKRQAKHFSFIQLNDGSCLTDIQIVVDAGVVSDEVLSAITTGASLQVTGKLVESQGKGQSFEIQASEVVLLGSAEADYPLQKKGHSVEFLREIAHLRPRTNLIGALLRVRSKMAFAVHTFFQEREFQYIHTPIITGSDCEGAGELFKVESTSGNSSDSGENNEFFGKPTYLTVSGQLEGETMACGLSNIYTFGPTFRAENSNTSRHANEFWMIEPEMAFCDLEMDMTTAEDFIKYLVQYALEHCAEDLGFFNKFVDKQLFDRLEDLLKKPSHRLSYKEAIVILKKSEKTFKYPIEYGVNLQSEHERYLTEEYFKSPVTVYDYPKEIKPFYMRQNDDGKTVAAMDVLVPGIGEIIGGSQREERLDVLLKNMKKHNIDEKDYWWYVDLRKYGTVEHSGFGLGFERLLMFVTGISNIRDVIPFPRTPGSAEF